MKYLLVAKTRVLNYQQYCENFKSNRRLFFNTLSYIDYKEHEDNIVPSLKMIREILKRYNTGLETHSNYKFKIEQII